MPHGVPAQAPFTCQPLCYSVVVAPPSLRHKAATDNTLQITEAHLNWPVYADVFEHPPSRLASQCSIWSDLTSVDTITQWREDWSSASAVHHTIVTDPTIRQPGFHLPRRPWSLLKAHVVQMGSRPIAFLWLWPVTDHAPHCRHVPINKFEGGLNLVHETDDDTVILLESTSTAARPKWMKMVNNHLHSYVYTFISVRGNG